MTNKKYLRGIALTCVILAMIKRTVYNKAEMLMLK
jgi:hypothetical protein